MNEQQNNIDVLDVVILFGSIMAVASTGVLALGLPLFGVYAAQHYYRRSAHWHNMSDKWLEPLPPSLQPHIRGLLGQPSDNEVTIKQTNPFDVRVVNNVDPYEDLPFWQRVTKPVATSDTSVVATVENKPQKNNDLVQTATLRKYLKALPSYLPYTALPTPPSKLAVPVGILPDKTILFGDFGTDGENKILHALVTGQTGTGKDALLRLWFTTLTMNNSPEDIKFVIIDGKIDWLSPALASSAFMAIPPAGGIDIRKIDGKRIDFAAERMAQSLDWIFEEIDRRQQEMSKVGAVDLASYRRKTGIKLPIIFFIASDVGETFSGELEMLVKQLIMKGRAFGIRMIMSMQNPVGESTKWRSQIGMVITGHQGDPAHDNRILGVPVAQMLIRPSQLPNPEENEIGKGLFIVRQGSKQHLVRTPHLPEDDWFSYIEGKQFIKHWYSPDEQTAFLEEALLGGNNKPAPVIVKPINPKDVLTHDQIAEIVKLARLGNDKTTIMMHMGWTNGNVWKAKSAAVDMVIKVARHGR